MGCELHRQARPKIETTFFSASTHTPAEERQAVAGWQIALRCRPRTSIAQSKGDLSSTCGEEIKLGLARSSILPITHQHPTAGAGDLLIDSFFPNFFFEMNLFCAR